MNGASPRAMKHIHAAAKDAGVGDTSQAIHNRLHGWAASLGYASLSDMSDHELDSMAWEIKADPEVMAAWFDGFIPEPWEAMDPTENAEPGDSATLFGRYAPDFLADLNAEADRIQRANHYRD